MRVQKVFEKPSRTQQSFREECDINSILSKFRKVMNDDYLNTFNGFVGGQFGDFSEVSDYQSALRNIKQGKAVFDGLPASVRRRFNFDPAAFLDFCHDPVNSDELVAMGLATRRQSPSSDVLVEQT